MADRVAVLSKGKLEQFAPPTEIYDAPGSLFVNTFVGAANVLTGVVTQLEGDIAWIGLPSGETLRARNPRGGISEGTRVSMCLRPEHLEIATTGPDGIAGIVEMGLPLGASIVHEVRIADGTAIKIATPRSPGIMPFAAGTAVRVLSAVPATIFPRT
jgi:putative spermidine/putrescine transport system ATP-binding protein